MTNQKHPKQWVSIVSSIVCFTILTACASNPEQEVVISKNDGSLDANVVQSATQPADQVEISTQNISFTDSFTSTDESVEFTFSINQTISNEAMPVVEVVSHYLTTEDAQRVASCLFGDVDFYEADPLLAPCYTREEIQNSIQRWSYYTNSEAISELLGGTDELVMERIKAKIEELNALYESAPSDSSRVPCKWTFQKDSVYTYSPEEVISVDTSFDNDAIMAVCEVNGIRYRYEVVTRNMGDYKLNMISAYFDSSRSPMSIDENIYRATLTRSSAPTDDQIAAVTSKAMDMLRSMELGEWQIDQCNVRALGENIVEYAICIDAVPVINGIPAVHQPQLTGLTSSGAYSSNYYMTEVSFEFSTNGDLLKFTMYSPIDVKQVINENVPTISVDDLLEKAKQHLSLSDSNHYGLQNVYGVLKEPLDTSVIISNIRYGLLREKVPETDDSYYYLPGIVLYGVVENVGTETQYLYYQSDEPYPIVALNAVDATVIAFTN